MIPIEKICNQRVAQEAKKEGKFPKEAFTAKKHPKNTAIKIDSNLKLASKTDLPFPNLIFNL